MKAILIQFLLLASIFILPSSTFARVLVNEKYVGIGNPNDPNRPAVSCPRGQPYRTCLPKPSTGPPKKCTPYSRGPGCTPTRK